MQSRKVQKKPFDYISQLGIWVGQKDILSLKIQLSTAVQVFITKLWKWLQQLCSGNPGIFSDQKIDSADVRNHTDALDCRAEDTNKTFSKIVFDGRQQYM